MAHKKVLIVNDDQQSQQIIEFTLNDAQLPYLNAASNEQACQLLASDPEISLVLVRAYGASIAGSELCRNIRQTASTACLPIMVLLRETELSGGAECLLAGANDLLVDPFEPRELRMRASIVPQEQNRRVDKGHTHAEMSPGTVAEPEFFIPELDPDTRQMTFGPYEHRIQRWQDDPNVTQIALDKIIVCPDCEAIPTFRPGCGCCGSAWVEHEVLIHHYACAHVGPEAEFLSSDGSLVCPKCRLRNLVTGSDFEQIQGCLKCTDCDALFAEPRMIAHCLNCDNRFPASEGKVKPVYAYQVGRSPNAVQVAQPNWMNAGQRNAAKMRSENT